MAIVSEIQTPQTTHGLATILAIGTANPPNAFYQSDYPDFYFRITNSEHMIDLKERFKRMCEKTKIKKRYMHISDEEILKQNPNICDDNSPSLNTRQVIQDTEIPKIGKEAAMKAIQEWGQPISKITHLIFCTTSPINIPGPDYHLTRLLGLNPSVKRYMFPQQGCYAGGVGLRLAKDLAENNQGARVLFVCSENTVMYFRSPSETHLIPQACLGDGAGAVIVGVNLNESSNERPIFQIVSTAQTILPNSHGAVESPLQENGATIRSTLTSVSLPELISNNIGNTLVEVFEPLGINDWNSIFWISHPGSHSIIENIESKLGLIESKLSSIRHVLTEYGNMLSASVIFVMDEMRKRSSIEGKATTGDGLDWGVLFGFGPGFTVETIVLRSFPL